MTPRGNQQRPALRVSVAAILLISVAAPSLAGARSGDEPGLLQDAAHGVETLAHDTFHVLTSPFRMDAGDALKLGGILAATGTLMIFDEEIRDSFNRNAEAFPLKPLVEVGRFLDPVAYGRMNLYYAGGLGVSYLAGWDRGTAMFGQILTSFAVYGLLKKPVALVVGRERPYQGRGAYSFGKSDATSFFSGHTTNIFQVATVVSHHVDRWWFTAAAYLAATGVAVQRVEADAHWPSDVFLSAAFAVAVAEGVIALHEKRRLAVMPHASVDGLGLSWSWRF